MTWPDFPTERKPQRWAWAPVWHAALRANRLLKAERKAHKATRNAHAVDLAVSAYRQGRIVDLEDKLRRLEANHNFLVSARFDQIAKGNEP